MILEDFIESYNSEIFDSQIKQYEFPGYSLEKMLDAYIDDKKAIQVTKTLFVEVKRSAFSWLFNLDYQDHTKFYKPSESELYRLPYMINELDDTENFFDNNFSYSLYWKTKNNQPATREFYD